MKICSNCLSVYRSSLIDCCLFDGNKIFDTCSIEAEEAVGKLLKKLTEGEDE